MYIYIKLRFWPIYIYILYSFNIYNFWFTSSSAMVFLLALRNGMLVIDPVSVSYKARALSALLLP